MNDLHEARTLAEEMFNDEGVQSTPVEEPTSGAAESAPEETAEPVAEKTESVALESVPGQMVEEAIASAEMAAQTAQQKTDELSQVTKQLAEISRQNEELKSTIEQMSQVQEEAITEQLLEPPVFDAEKILYGDAESQAKALTEYQNKLNEYNKAMIRKDMEEELAPIMEFARQGMEARDKADALKAIKEAVPEMSDIDSKAGLLDTIIEQNPFLSGSDKPMEEKYIMAYMLARGVDAVNNPPVVPEPPKEPTAQELMEYARNNKEFAEMLAMEKIAAVQSGQQVPPLSASSGAVNAAPTIQNEPKNLEEATELFKNMLRV